MIRTHRSQLRQAIAGTLAAFLAIAPVFGEKADRKIKAEIFGIEGDANQGQGTFRLSRDVRITQGTLRITADRADVRTTEDEQYFAVLTAKPVCFRQRTDNGSWAQGVAERVEYDSQRGIVELFGSANLFVGDDETRANYIVYNTQLGTYEARDSKDRKTQGKGVTFVLQPREKEEKPAAAAPGTAAATAPAASGAAAAAVGEDPGKAAAPKALPKPAKPIVVQTNPPKRNEPAFSRCA